MRLTRIENVNFDWGSGAPGSGVNSEQLLGALERHDPSAGHRHLPLPDRLRRRRPRCGSTARSSSTTGRRTPRPPNTSGTLNLVAGTRYTITLEYYEASGQAEIRLRWLTPGNGSYVIVPANRLYPN